MTGPATGLAAAAEVAAHLDRLGGWVRTQLVALGALVVQELAGPAPRRHDLAIEEPCRTLLARAGELPLAGCGFVAAPNVLVDAPYWLEWWTADHRVGAASCRRLAAETDPSAVGFRDYTELPWFVGPQQSGSMQVTGPYIDYVCTDQHTLTVTMPVSRTGEFIGVVGLDVLAATLETVLAPGLDVAPVNCVVINSGGRVVAAAEPTLLVGDLIRGLPLAPWFAGESAEHEDWDFSPAGALRLGVLSAR